MVLQEVQHYNLFDLVSQHNPMQRLQFFEANDMLYHGYLYERLELCFAQ
jgi:hypothetical protein